MKNKICGILCLILSVIMVLSAIPYCVSSYSIVSEEFFELPSYYGYINVDTVMAGDITGDGKVNNKDLTRLFQFLSNWDVDVVEGAVDVTGDGKVNNKDLTRLFQFLSNWDVQIFAKETAECQHSNTEVRNARAATCNEQGYTGDIYCVSCGELISNGTYTEPLEHSGGNATYYQKAECENCGEEYGDYSQIYAYDSLNENQKNIYNEIDSAISRLEKGKIYLEDYADDALTGESDVNVAIRAISYDKPEYFWMPKNYSVGTRTNSRTGKLIELYVSFADTADPERGMYHVTEEEKAQMQEELEAVVDEIVLAAKSYETNFERETYIHDYLCNNIIYAIESAEDYISDFRSFTTYGALILGSCVCEGYSRAMQLICQRLGIPCGLITGLYLQPDGSDPNIIYGTPHMWNIINPGDGCCYLDVTFDDAGYDLFPLWHHYFNITLEEISEDHMADDMFAEGENYSDPEYEFNFFDTHGNETQTDFYTQTGAHIKADDATVAADYIIAANQEGKVAFDIQFDESITPANAIKLLNRALEAKGSNIQFSNYVYLESVMYLVIST